MVDAGSTAELEPVLAVDGLERDCPVVAPAVDVVAFAVDVVAPAVDVVEPAGAVELELAVARCSGCALPAVAAVHHIVASFAADDVEH